MTARATVDGKPLAFVDGEWRESALKLVATGVDLLIERNEARAAAAKAGTEADLLRAELARR